MNSARRFLPDFSDKPRHTGRGNLARSATQAGLFFSRTSDEPTSLHGEETSSSAFRDGGKPIHK